MTLTTLILLILIGIVAGFVSGLIGIGGGVLIVPALVLLLGFSQKLAQGTSLGIMLLPIGLLAVIQYHKEGYLNINYAAIVAVSFILGSFFGSKLAVSLSDDKVKKIFAVILLVIALKMLFFDKGKPTQTKANEASVPKLEQSGN